MIDEEQCLSCQILSHYDDEQYQYLSNAPTTKQDGYRYSNVRFEWSILNFIFIMEIQFLILMPLCVVKRRTKTHKDTDNFLVT
jgi:hypothetical protein